MANDGDFDGEDSRSFDRCTVNPPILATFGSIDIHITDFAIRGFRARHDDPLHPGLTAKVVCAIPPRVEIFRFEAEVIWSRLALEKKGRFRFESGFRVEKNRLRAIEALQHLLEADWATEERIRSEGSEASISGSKE